MNRIILVFLLMLVLLTACGSKTLPTDLQLYTNEGVAVKKLSEDESKRATGVANDVESLKDEYGKILIFPPVGSGDMKEEAYWYKLSDLTDSEKSQATGTNEANNILGKAGNWFNTLSVDTIVPVTAWGWWLFVILFGVLCGLFVAIPISKDQDGFNLSYRVLGWTSDRVQMEAVIGVFIQPSPTLGNLRRRLNFAGATRTTHGQINYDVGKIIGITDELVSAAVNTVIGNLTPAEVGTLQSNGEALAEIRKAISDTFLQTTGFHVLEITVPKVRDTMGVLSARASANAAAEVLVAPAKGLIGIGVDPNQAALVVASNLRSNAISKMGSGVTPIVDVEGDPKE